MYNRDPRDDLPDVRDGLTRRERVVLWCLSELQKERGDRHVPTGMLYGSVVEYVNRGLSSMRAKNYRSSMRGVWKSSIS